MMCSRSLRKRKSGDVAATASALALVLAGGNGMRLGELTRWECKPALPFGGKFRNIDFSLSNCLHSGIRRIAVLTQYKSQTLIHHLDEAWSFLPGELGEFVHLWPAQQRLEAEWYSGTANAVFQNLDLIRAHDPRLVLVLAGDHVYKMDWRRMLLQHVQSGAEVTVACVPVPAAEAGSFGVLTLNGNGRIARFLEKPSPEQTDIAAGETVLASMGVYAFNAEYLYERLARDAQSLASTHDFGRDLIPAAVNAGEAHGFVFTDAAGDPGYWRDVGTLDSYWKAHMELLGPDARFSVFDPEWPIFTNPRQLPPAQLVCGTRACSLSDALVSEGCIVDSATVIHSVLGSGVHVGEESVLQQVIVLPEAQIGPRSRLSRAVVETGCVVPAGTVIGEDAAADAKRFAISAGGVALVTGESLLSSERRVA